MNINHTEITKQKKKKRKKEKLKLYNTYDEYGPLTMHTKKKKSSAIREGILEVRTKTQVSHCITTTQ